MADTQPIRLTDAAPFTFGGVTVAPAARAIRGARELIIEPRVMQVLVLLHQRRGDVVGREALIDGCWGGRMVGEDAINRAILKLRRALDEVGGDMSVETVAKVGYRLCAAEAGGLADPAPVDDARPRRFRRRWLAALGFGAAAALAACGFFLFGPRDFPALKPCGHCAAAPGCRARRAGTAAGAGFYQRPLACRSRP